MNNVPVMTKKTELVCDMIGSNRFEGVYFNFINDILSNVRINTSNVTDNKYVKFDDLAADKCVSKCTKSVRLNMVPYEGGNELYKHTYTDNVNVENRGFIRSSDEFKFYEKVKNFTNIQFTEE